MRRIALAFALAACASPAFAVQDRYGPPPTEAPFGARVAPAPAGPMLDWQGKTAAPQAAGAPGTMRRPEPLAPWAQRAAPPQATAIAPASAAQAQTRPLPPPADAPRPYAPRAAANAPVATAQAPGAAARPRFYSVSRQYGAEPDPIPVAAAAPRGPALTLSEVPASENLGRTQAPLDDGRANQAVQTPVTRENAASNRVSRFGL